MGFSDDRPGERFLEVIGAHRRAHGFIVMIGRPLTPTSIASVRRQMRRRF